MKLNHKLIANWGAKVLSVVLALFVVLAIEFSTITNRVVTIPISVQLPPKGDYTPSSLVPTKINIVISGDEDVIYLVDPAEVHAHADFSNVSGGGIVQVPVLLEYNQNVYQRDSISLRADPSSVRILFSEVTK